MNADQLPTGVDLLCINTTRVTLIKSFDRFGMNGNFLIPFVVSLSNHDRNTFNQCYPG